MTMRKTDARYLGLIRSLPCLICGTTAQVEAAHLRMADARYEAAPTGTAIKPDDWRTLPLCAAHHREGPDAQHSKAETTFWGSHGVDPLPLAERLYAAFSGAAGGLGIFRGNASGDPGLEIEEVKIAIDEQIDEQMKVCRQFRKAVPRMLKDGKISQEDADMRVARQQAALKTLQYVATNRDAFMKAVNDANQ